jgi:hypothetical protein
MSPDQSGMMSSPTVPAGLEVTATALRNGNMVQHVEVKFANTTGADLDPGGLRFIAVKRNGDEYKISVAHLWPVRTEESVSIVASVPFENWSGVLRLKSFEFVETTGRVYPIDGSVDVSFWGRAKLASKGSA